MGTYGISGLGGTIIGGGGGSGRAGARTEYPTTYVPNCVTNDGLILNRADHLEVLLHVRYPRRGIARVTRYFTPGPSGMWGSGRYAQNFRGMVRRAPISLADFKNWIARQVPSMFPGATLIAPGVCVKTVWRGDHTRVDAPPYVPPTPPAPPADTGPLPAHIPLDTGSGWSIVGDRPSRAGTPASGGRPLPTWAGGLLFGGGAGTPGGPGIDAGGGESACSGGGGMTAPPGTDATGEDVAAPPGTDAETPDSVGSQASWYQANKKLVWGAAAVAAVAATLFGVFKVGRRSRKSNRRKNSASGPYELVYSTGGHGGPYPTLSHAKARAEGLLRGNPNERWIAIVKASDVTNLWDAVAVNVISSGDYGSNHAWIGATNMSNLIGSRRRNRRRNRR